MPFMEFNEKLQQLRKEKGFTQEELAEALFVSRTAVSKWESGRGYPNIESLKAIAKLFSVTVDELLSSDEVLTIAEEEQKERQSHLRDLVFGLLDISVALCLFLPFFAQRGDGAVQAVSLLALSHSLKAVFLAVVIALILLGVLTLALQNSCSPFWMRHKYKLSALLNGLGAVLFTISLQPYAAVFLLVYLLIKALMVVKK